MRCWWVAFCVIGCSTQVPLGVYRLPVQTSPNTVDIKTVLVRTDPRNMYVFDAATGTDIGKGVTDGSGMADSVPFTFSAPPDYPLSLTLSADVLQDNGTRPYATLPIVPLDPGGDHVVRVTLASGAEVRTVISSGGVLFTEAAEPQPELSTLPSPLFAMSSVAGTGLLLPTDAASGTLWRDGVSQLVPPDPKAALPCAAPFVASITSTPNVTIQVPDGQFQTLKVVEILDACVQPQRPALKVFQIDRWYAPGVGPVQMTYTGSDSKIRSYVLTSHTIQSAGSALWPLSEGNSWTYEVRGADGTIVSPSVDVAVRSVSSVSAPK